MKLRSFFSDLGSTESKSTKRLRDMRVLSTEMKDPVNGCGALMKSDLIDVDDDVAVRNIEKKLLFDSTRESSLPLYCVQWETAK